MANIYDVAFRTILNDCRKLIIPVINEIFGETYTGEEEIRFFPNEHFLDQQDDADKKRVTDTNFTVFGKMPKKYHVECESSLPDGKITIRLFEYDAQIALDEGEVTEETLTVTFPNTAVLYLRTYKKTPDKISADALISKLLRNLGCTENTCKKYDEICDRHTRRDGSV